MKNSLLYIFLLIIAIIVHIILISSGYLHLLTGTSSKLDHLKKEIQAMQYKSLIKKETRGPLKQVE